MNIDPSGYAYFAHKREYGNYIIAAARVNGTGVMLEMNISMTHGLPCLPTARPVSAQLVEDYASGRKKLM